MESVHKFMSQRQACRQKLFCCCQCCCQIKNCIGVFGVLVVAWLPILLLHSIYWWIVEENTEKAAAFRAQIPSEEGIAKLYESYWWQSTVLRVVLLIFQTLQAVFFICGRCYYKQWSRWAFYYTFIATFLF